MTFALLCFLSTYVSVFALGLQSLNVNQGHYWAAASTSLLIGAGHIGLYKYMPTAGTPELVGYLIGGVTGITSSMWFHRVMKAWWIRTSDRRAAYLADAIEWPGNFLRACLSDLDAWYEQELRRLTQPPAKKTLCSRCATASANACWRVDCPFHGTDVH